ncbi:hypothetical protein HB777_07125 [Mesorhizobium loti]|nr:hypothetical protein HB777_07125 [Mesorhizobium loti]
MRIDHRRHGLGRDIGGGLGLVDDVLRGVSDIADDVVGLVEAEDDTTGSNDRIQRLEGKAALTSSTGFEKKFLGLISSKTFEGSASPPSGAKTLLARFDLDLAQFQRESAMRFSGKTVSHFSWNCSGHGSNRHECRQSATRRPADGRRVGQPPPGSKGGADM